MVVGIYEKIKGQTGEKTKTEFLSYLEKYGVSFIELSEKNEACDLIVVFGGDGTVLTAVSRAIGSNTPILAINTGTLGFLTSFEENEIELAAKKIRDGKLAFSERSLLEISCENGKTAYALNDAVIERTSTAESRAVIAKLGVEIDGNPVYTLGADGVIVASPTGSTAYSLSAGGVILDPGIPSFILTPICSHSFGTRPIVFPDNKKVSVKVLANSSECVLTLDGRFAAKLSEGEEVRIGKSKNKLKLAENEKNFYQRLKQKIG